MDGNEERAAVGDGERAPRQRAVAEEPVGQVPIMCSNLFYGLNGVYYFWFGAVPLKPLLWMFFVSAASGVWKKEPLRPLFFSFLSSLVLLYPEVLGFATVIILALLALRLLYELLPVRPLLIIGTLWCASVVLDAIMYPEEMAMMLETNRTTEVTYFTYLVDDF